MKYAGLVIDNKSDQTDQLYTYGYEDMDLHVGSVVNVSFARSRKLKKGFVVTLDDEPDESVRDKLKMIDSVNEELSLSEEMIATAAWIKTRYLCRFIDAIKLFTPAGSKAKRKNPKNPLEDVRGELTQVDKLTREQEDALGEIEAAIEMRKHERFLIHGVTGSGKTEVYMRAAADALNKGRTVIVLVPEISLTDQIATRFIGRFGSKSLAILHSRLTSSERYEQWQRIRSGEVNIVIGARSAVFAPLENIGLIVIDEEHESTYKSDFTPKYDTVEVALKRTQDKNNNGVLLLGSATPSVVTYSRAQEGIYKIITMKERYNRVPLPKVDIVDMRDELKAGNRTSISRLLHDKIKETLDCGKQVMLFLNRRGYSTFLSCRECGHVITCPTCGLSLTYHKNRNVATCHYCGREEIVPKKCPECGSKYIRFFGTGTEKLQETVQEQFAECTVDRLDLDTIKARGELNKKLRAFKRNETNILIGTQIIAKGLDFKNVGLVGIVSADVSLNIPDFRSPERTFQLITQAAGRAGRGEEEGQVVIQTYSPDNYAICHAAEQDYEGFFEEETMIRRVLAYPPYSDLYQVVFLSENESAALEGARDWYDKIKARLADDEKNNVFRPQQAYMSKIDKIYRFTMLIKCPKGNRRLYSAMIEQIRQEDRRKKKKDYTAVVDINPYSFS